MILKDKNLTEIMDFYGSDKGSITHNYTNFYESIFSRENFTHIFELGIGTINSNIPSSMPIGYTPGSSLRAWRDYFYNASIYGADIDNSILILEERINTYHVDQTDAQSINILWSNTDLENIKFDLMIDDGLHTFNAAECFLENSFYKLKPKGIYIIEDVITTYINNYINFLDKLKYKYNFNYEIKLINEGINVWGGSDNCLVIIRNNI